MRRFMFYHKRWAVHDDSRCKEQELVERIELRVQSLLAARGQPAEMRLAVRIEEALIRLVECRRILAHSYIFCYYAFGDDVKLNHGLSLAQVAISQPLFEDFQQALESRLEILSALMDKVGNAGDVDADEVLAITKVACRAGQGRAAGHTATHSGPRAGCRPALSQRLRLCQQPDLRALPARLPVLYPRIAVNVSQTDGLT
jgi:hypothetical protein